MLFWLLDKVKESSQNEASRQRYEAEKRDAEKARIRINDLCKAEVERLGKSPVIVEVYNSVFNTGRCVEKFITKNDGIVVFFTDSTSVTIQYKSMGIRDLPEWDTTIFDSERLLYSVNWSNWGSILEDCSTYYYVYFCHALRRNNDSEKPVFPHFDYRLAIGYLLAEKTGLQYKRPYWNQTSCGKTMSYEFSFDTQSKLKSW